VFDMTGGEPYVTNGQTDTAFVRAIDDVSDSKTGTINYFAATHLAWNSTGISSDTPVSIPDYNVGVHARAKILRPTDVGVTAILAPTGTVDSGTAVTPQARVKNYGVDAASFPVTFRIGTSYTNTKTVSNLAAGDSTLVSFNTWTAGPRGTYATRCTTALTGDQVPGNDALSGSVAVRVTNVGVTAIVAPPDTVDSGTVVTPKARVKNHGTDAATFPVFFRIGSFYSNSQTVTNLAAGDSVQVSFTNWTAVQLGTHVKRCSTAMTGDQVYSNDTLSGSVTVVPASVTDVGVTAIVAPAGTVDSGTTITPQARVKNFGNNAATFPVKLSIDTGYANTQTVTNLAAGDSVQVSFTSWTAVQRGPHATRCTTALTGDQNHTNDTLSGSVMVRVKDIGVVSINKPAGSYGQGEIVTPAATIRNYGNVPAGFEVWMLLRNPTGALYYSDSVNVVNLDTAKNLVVDAFRPCTLQLLGDWTAKCSTALSGDLRLDNNVMTGGFKIRPPWVERKSVPGPPSYRPVKDGAWLAYDAGSGLVYAGKGNNSSDFYSYDIADNDWTSLRAIPLGLEAKLPRQGACGVGDGSGYIYMAKGNNTLGFWRYDIATDSWLQLANLPVGGSGRRVKAGSGVAYVQIGDSGFVYLLKGPTCEFYRFNVATGTWGTMQSAPAGSYSKWYDGSFLVFDGDHAIYAHKARYHELWAYDVLTATWSSTQLNGMPFVGRDASSRRSRGGGSGAWFAGGIYALKGGSTSEFWRYDATADTWTEFNQLPLMGSSGNRKVSAGGCIVSVDDTLFALKGNQTTELWRYGLGSSLKALQTSHEGVMAEQAFDIRHSTFDIRLSPNPLASGFAVLRYSLPKAGLVTLNAFDVAGRTVLTQTLVVGRTGTARFDLRKLEAGVYIVKVTTEGFSTTQKLVVEH
jgi:hypothetical protein